jgi:energy-coupling factor transporter ATP-binding protein EcfA2
MAFRFTEEDFNRYVKKEEHGGRHIWDDLREQLQTLVGVPFAPKPFEVRGDWLQMLWFAPKGTPRSVWSYQAQFFLARDVQKKQLKFGLDIECPPRSKVAAWDLDPDLDGIHLIEQLESDPAFAILLDALTSEVGWKVEASEWDKERCAPDKSAELLSVLKRMSPEQGWSVEIRRVLNAEEAVSAGEGIIAKIMDAYQAVCPLWEMIIPRAVQEFIRNDEISLITAKQSQNKSIPLPPKPSKLCTILASTLASRNLHFTDWQLATFYTALQTKGFVILSGISGTGKTKLAQHFAALLPQPTDSNNWLFVPVRPDWRDSKSLLGYFNPLTGTYEWTPFLRFLLRAAQSYRDGDGLAWFVILDEMNLAHVEYYFADLLSVLESGRDGEGWTREPLRLLYPDDAEGDLPPRELRLPPNLYIVGTVNVDETTHAFSPKVLDRAFTLELTEADFANYPPALDGATVDLDGQTRQAIQDDFTFGGEWTRVDKPTIADHIAVHPEVRAQLQMLNSLLRPYDLHFGYRVFDEIVSFLDAAEHNGLFADLGDGAAFDAAVLMKVLPKFHGSRGKLEGPLQAVLAWCVNPDAPAQDMLADELRKIESGDDVAETLSQITYRCPATARRAIRLLRALYADGFAAFG